MINDVFYGGGGVYGFEEGGNELGVKEDSFCVCFSKGMR